MINRLSEVQAWLTRRYAWIRGGVVDQSEYSACGVSRTVFWYDQETRRAGDFSPFGTILMNQHLPEGIPEEFRDYVFLHEVGHGEAHPVLRLLYLPCVLGAFTPAFAGAVALPVNLVNAIRWASDPISRSLFLGIAVGVSALAILPLVGLLWLDETYAELHAISYLGTDRYSEIRSQVRENRDPSFLRKIRYYIQYPPRRLVLKIAQLREIGV